MERSTALLATTLLFVACDHASESPSDERLPEQPTTFRIELSGSACYGSCPTYSVAIDQDGAVTFVGEQCVARPGVFHRTVPAADARAIYDALLASPYPTLKDRYRTEEDGCRVFTDAPTSTWLVDADKSRKPLEHYHGCDDVPALDQVASLEGLLQERAGVRDWLDAQNVYCQSGVRLPSSASYRLSLDGAAVGIVKIDSSNRSQGTFELRDCAGELTAHGSVLGEPGRYQLIEALRSSISLPNDLGAAGGLTLEDADRTETDAIEPIRARALREDDETLFDVTVATTCS